MRPAEEALVTLRRTLVEQLEAAEAAVESLRDEIAGIDRALGVVSKGDPLSPHVARPSRKGARLSMKDLTLEALRDHFPEGATVNDLLSCFSERYQRPDIARTSLSPQLTRLKEEGRISRSGMVWHLNNADAGEETK